MSVRDIKKTFIEGGQPLHILRGGGFDLHRGEIIALVGPSGSGKSTLLQCVGLLDKPTSGSIVISGMPVQKMSEDVRTVIRRKKIGFVFQNFNLMMKRTIADNVSMPLIYQGVGEAECRERALKMLKIVGFFGYFRFAGTLLPG